MSWRIESASPQAHRITFSGVKSGWEQWALLTSDDHFDNAKCDLVTLARHHQEAKDRDAVIVKHGDMFCAMQGKWDKRSDQNQLRPEHRGNNYLDKLVDTGADFYAPYAKWIVLVSGGNHEGSIDERHQTSLIDRFIEGLHARSGHRPVKGSYSGFIRFSFGPRFRTFDYHWHHGYGGGGEVTRGLIDNNRTRGQAIADIYYSGHIHRRNMDENVILAMSERLTVKERVQFFLRGSTYKDEHKGGNGWHVVQGRAAKPKGGWWLRFHCPNGTDIICEPIPAI